MNIGTCGLTDKLTHQAGTAKQLLPRRQLLNQCGLPAPALTAINASPNARSINDHAVLDGTGVGAATGTMAALINR